MPLTDRGKKIMKSMKERYGKKKGEQIFYATKNKGKLKNVEKAYLGKAIKQPTETKKEFQMRHAYHTPFMKKPKGFRGGGMDMGSKASQAKSAAMGNPGGEGRGRDPSKQFEDKASISQVSRDALAAQRQTFTKNLSSQGQQQVAQKKVSTPNVVGKTIASSFIKPKMTMTQFFSGFTNALDTGLGIPVTPAGLAITSLKAIENQRRAKRAKGEYFTSSKKIMPANRDFYRQYGRKLDTKIGTVDEDYLKEAGISGFGIPPNPKEGVGVQKTLCADGTLPPCKTPITTPGTTKDPFLSDFKTYNKGGDVVISSNVDRNLLSGGVRFGPPPKRGPNPNVPPIKMKKGGYKK